VFFVDPGDAAYQAHSRVFTRWLFTEKKSGNSTGRVSGSASIAKVI